MSKVFHVGKNGPAECTATKRSCPLGLHYTDFDKANKAWIESQEFETFETLRKDTVKKNALAAVSTLIGRKDLVSAGKELVKCVQDESLTSEDAYEFIGSLPKEEGSVVSYVMGTELQLSVQKMKIQNERLRTPLPTRTPRGTCTPYTAPARTPRGSC